MKKLKTTLTLSAASLLLFSRNCFAATATNTASSGISSTKYLAIGVAAVIVILLLFLGYKMDSKGDGEPTFTSKKSRKKEKPAKKPVVKYEPDKVTYEKDDVNSKDLSEPVEYEEDEDSLYSSMNDETPETPNFSVDNEDDLGSLEDSSDGLTENTENNEEYGEEFDTSIIDDIDDEEVPEETTVETPKTTSEETMIFNNPPASETKDELTEEFNNIDPTMDELKNIDTTETSFGGFSVSDNTSKKENVDEAPKAEKPRKKYTKVKKDTTVSTDDFLAQMEENLKKDKEERDARKSKK